MFERVGAKKTEKGVAVFMRAYGTYLALARAGFPTGSSLLDE
jgi:hypothetical protein